MGLKLPRYLERGAEEKPDDVPTAPVRKITSAWHRTDQIRNRTWTTVGSASRKAEQDWPENLGHERR